MKGHDIYANLQKFSVSRPKDDLFHHKQDADSGRSITSEEPSGSSRTRFIILVLSTLCLSALQSNALTFNITVICMADSEALTAPLNGTESSPNRYSYSPSEKSVLFSAVAVGAIVAVYPMMVLVQRVGTRWVTTAFGVISALSTAAVPFAASLGFSWLLATRLIQGTGLSIAFTFIAVVTREWSMAKQSAFFIAFLTCFFQVAPMFTMPVAGALCSSSLGWPSVYFLHSALTLLLFALFAFFYRDRPSRHRLVSPKELERIQRMKGGNADGKMQPVPYRAMFSSIGVWAVWVTAVGNFMAIQVTMQFTPIYLNKVMGYSVEESGMLASIPQAVTFASKIVAGLFSDRLSSYFSPSFSTKAFNTFSVGGMGVLCVVQAFIPTSSPLLALVVLTACTSIVGFNCGGFFRGSSLMAAQHNHFIMSVNSLINCLSALLCPLVVRLLVANDEWEEWRNVFIVFGALLLFGNAFYCVFGEAEAAEWTKTKSIANISTIHPFPSHNIINTTAFEKDPAIANA